MPYIKVDIRKISGYGTDITNVKTRVNSIKSSFYSTGSALDWDVKACSGINRTISQINGELTNEIASLKRMESFFAMAAKKYSDVNKMTPASKAYPQLYMALGPGSVPKDVSDYRVLNTLLFNNKIQPAKTATVVNYSERLSYVVDKGWKNIIKAISGEGDVSDFASIGLLATYLLGDDNLSDAAKKTSENKVLTNIVKALAKSIKPIILAQYGYSVIKNGDYYIVTGSRALKGIKGLSTLSPGRYSAEFVKNNAKYFKNINVGAAVSEANSLKSLTAKLAAVGMIVDIGKGIYDNVKDGATIQHTAADAVVDTVIGGGKIFASAAAGAAVGSIIPGAGTVVGAIVGAAAGVATNFLVDKTFDIVLEDLKVYDGKSIKQIASEGFEWVIEKSSEGLSIAGQAIAETARSVGENIKVGVKNIAESARQAGEDISQKISDGYDTLKNNIVNKIMNIKIGNVVRGKAVGCYW